MSDAPATNESLRPSETPSNFSVDESRLTPASDDNKLIPASASVGRLAGVFAATLAMGLATRGAYLSLPFVEDDFDFLFQIGLARTGKLPYFFMFLAPQGPHPMFAWKACYLLEWLLFGLDPFGWHLVAAVIHSIGATALFVVLRLYFQSEIGAWFGALLWGGAAIGNWDNPHAWLMCGMIPLSTSWFLIAMALLPRIGRPGDRKGAWLFGFALSAALLSWGDSLAFFPLIALQYLLLERPRGNSNQIPRRWIVAAMIPTLLWGSMQVALILPQLGAEDRQREFDLGEVLRRTIGQLSVALGTLVYGDVDPRRPEAVIPKTLLAVAALFAWLVLPGGRRRIAMIFLAWGLLYSLMTNVGGGNIDYTAAVHSGHYLYIPALAWCVLAGAWAAVATRKQSKIVVGALVLLLGFFVFHQRQVAASTRDYTLATFAETTALFAQNQALATELELSAATQGRRIRLPEFPVPLKAATSSGFWPISSFLAVCRPQGFAGLQVVPIDRAAERDYAETFALLRQSRNPIAPLWIERLERSRKYGQGLLWLSAYARRTGDSVRLPDFWISDGTMRCKAAGFLSFAFSSPPERLTASKSSMTQAEMLALADRLARSPEAAARTWSGMLTELSKGMP